MAEKHPGGRPLFDGPGVPEGVTLPFPTHDLKSLSPKETALFAAWLLNGQDVEAAARQIGMPPLVAKKAFEESQGLRDAKFYVDRIAAMEDKDWPDILADARRSLRMLMLSKDAKVRFWATKEIIDRAEGKAVARVDMTIRDERPSLSDAELQLVFSIMQANQVGFAEAQQWIRQFPDAAQKWIEQNVQDRKNQKEQKGLPPGREIISDQSNGSGSGEIQQPQRRHTGVWAPPPYETDELGMRVA